MNNVELIKAELKPLFERARKENLLFYERYTNSSLTPDELEHEQKHGRYIWGAVNWQLVPPDTVDGGYI